MLTQPNCGGINVNTLPIGAWTGLQCNGFIRYDFAGPVLSAELEFFSINTNDFATITVNNSGTVTLSNGVCVSLSGNVAGPYTGPGLAGTVRLTVSSNLPFTQILLVNTGCESGWVAVCPTSVILDAGWNYFAATPTTDGHVDLDWQMEKPIDNAWFRVERSHDGRAWEVISDIRSPGTPGGRAIYSHTDRDVPAGLQMYRIKQLDTDGSHVYSETKAVLVAREMLVYPTVTAARIHVSGISSPEQVAVYDLLGARLFPAITKSPDGLDLDFGPFRPGMYLVQGTQDGQVWRQRVVLER